MNRKPTIKDKLWFTAACVTIVAALLIISHNDYLLFHCFIELFSISVGCVIFMLVWNARRIINNNYLLLLGIGYLFIALIDLIHTLAYQGMGVFENSGANLATQLWIAARYMQCFTLLAGSFLLGRKIKTGWLLAIYIFLTSLVLVSIFRWHIFPKCYVEDVGLTKFKKISEYIISVTFICSALVLWSKRQYFDKRVLKYLIAAILAAVLSELSFTLYLNVDGIANQIGHFLKLASFYLLYKAAIETGLREPYSVLLHNLNQSRDQVVREMEKTRHYLDVAGVIMVVIDADEKVILINRRGCEILGYPREEILGKNWFDNFVPEEDRDNCRDIFRKLMQEEVAVTDYFENSVIDSNSLERTIAWYHSLLLDNEGNITAILSSGEDITQQKHDQEQIRQQKEMLETTIEALTHPFYVINADDYTVKTANSAAWQYAQKNDDIKCYALTNGRCEACAVENDICPVNVVKRTKEPVTVEQTHYDKNGNERFSEIYAYPIFDRDRNVKEVIEYCVDITERKLAEQEIENIAKFPSEDPNPVLRITKDGKVLYSNKAGQELLEDWKCKVGECVPDSWRQYVLRILATGSEEILEVVCGQKIFSLTIAPLVEPGYVNVYGTDVTQRNQAEEDLRKYREHLEELVHKRTEELTDTNKKLRAQIEQCKKLEKEILNISEREQRRIGQELHDSLGQQLTGISFMTRVLEKRLLAKEIEEAAAVAEIARLVNEATNQARGLAKGLHPVDLDSGSLVSSLAELASSTQHLFGISCTFSYDKSLNIKKSENIVHLYRIAQEAVTNAIKHGLAKNIQIQIIHVSGKAILTIENDGREFPKNYEAHGAGIGLQIMSHRVDLIGGTLTICKGPNEGTIVTCTFPLEND